MLETNYSINNNQLTYQPVSCKPGQVQTVRARYRFEARGVAPLTPERATANGAEE